MTRRKLAETFLHKADQDRVAFEKWRSDPEISVDILGFHAQQAAEKMLKAILASKGVVFPFTHRLADLIDLIKENKISFPENLEELRFLTPFAIEFRYQLYEEEEEPFDSENIYAQLTELREWIINIFPPSEDEESTDTVDPQTTG